MAKGQKSNFSFITYILPVWILKLFSFTWKSFCSLHPHPPSVSIFSGTSVLRGNLCDCRKLLETGFDINLHKPARWSSSVKMAFEYWVRRSSMVTCAQKRLFLTPIFTLTFRCIEGERSVERCGPQHISTPDSWLAFSHFYSCFPFGWVMVGNCK